ncbi:MAG: hypothetical protein ACFFEV_06765 [Candidatus Thorarchaeota archaeon]
MSSEDNVRTDEYWMGVRDALRMVDSFHRWSKRNPDRAKDLEDFIHDGLIAAAKRCESCLREKMGLSFTNDEDEPVLGDEIESLDDVDEADEVEVPSIEFIELDKEPEVTEPDITSEEPIDHTESEEIASKLEDVEESSISLDSVERREDEPMEDLSIEGPPREFTTDFELVEPAPLVVDEKPIPEIDDEPEPTPELEPEEVVSEEIESESPSEELPETPSFSWSEYEEAVTPSSEPEPLDPDEDIIPSEDEEVGVEIEDEPVEEPPDPPKVWTPYDEPSITEDDYEDEEEPEEEESTQLEEGEDEPVITEPPPPPPPPESEEDEEERKRRARRLFFGA